MTTNPSHILIARNSRGGAHNPQLSSPIETHAAAAGTVFRSSGGSPPGPWLLEECDDPEDSASVSSSIDSDDLIDVDETFTKEYKLPGTVKVVVENTTFWAHKEILYFACPFFAAALGGGWAETGQSNRRSISSVITISQPPIVPNEPAEQTAENNRSAAHTELTFASPDTDGETDESDVELIEASGSAAKHSNGGGAFLSAEAEAGASSAWREREREKAQARLESGRSSLEKDKGRETISPTLSHKSSLKVPAAQAKVKRRTNGGRDAVIVLKEERAFIFHEFLKYIYPHLDCTITWVNVEGLMNISHKLCVPALTRECTTFLLTHAAGRPIKAMRIAELFEDEELYCEASRFVLDNPGGWSEEELGMLGRESLLKLEKRRTWFLERVLKLGLVQVAKEYQCCATCPDTATCARLLEEKWKQAYHAVFRFGPCQPSMVFRYLRNLEGISPPLSLAHLACQTTAKTFVATLFDRMFSLGMRGSGTDTAPIGTRVATAASGPRRHFLYCTLKAEPGPRSKRSRDAS